MRNPLSTHKTHLLLWNIFSYLLIIDNLFITKDYMAAIWIVKMTRLCTWSLFNKQPSFNVKFPRAQLVKIDYMILVCLLLTGKTIWL